VPGRISGIGGRNASLAGKAVLEYHKKMLPVLPEFQSIYPGVNAK
jgi:hypothetical protein